MIVLEQHAQWPSCQMPLPYFNEVRTKRLNEFYSNVRVWGTVWKSRWTSRAPVPNIPTVSVDVKQPFNQPISYSNVRVWGAVWRSRWTSWAPVPNKPAVSMDVKEHFNQPSTATSVTARLLVGQGLNSHPTLSWSSYVNNNEDALLLCFLPANACPNRTSAVSTLLH